jgi:hypothetical protein
MTELDDVTSFIGEGGFAERGPVSGLIPAKKARIAWDHGVDGRITKVLVTANGKEWRRADRFSGAGGACFAGWMKPISKRTVPDFGPDQFHDPAGTFGTMLAAGFATKRALREALKQFAKIDACGWARRMLFAIDGEIEHSDLDKPA